MDLKSERRVGDSERRMDSCHLGKRGARLHLEYDALAVHDALRAALVSKRTLNIGGIEDTAAYAKTRTHAMVPRSAAHTYLKVGAYKPSPPI